MQRLLLFQVMLGCLLFGQSSKPRTLFRVKYVAEGSVYLDGGRNAGLSEGMKLTVSRDAGTPAGGSPRVIAELEITAVAAASAACEVKNSREDVKPGDQVYLSTQDGEMIQAMKSAEAGKKYAQVVSFTEGDPLEEEARAAVPHPPSPAVNRTRGRIGFEYNTIRQDGGPASSQAGLVFRADMTRIGGTFWSLSGYWRGRINTRGGTAQSQTITDLLNRTYHLTLFYNSPHSPWMAGVGRFYLPWASSLETIDGGYIAHRVKRSFTVGTFAGSTPDPTSWNYNPNRQLVGSFVNYASGSFESLHVTSTSGVAVSRVNWKPERQFAFFENGLYYKQYLSVFHNLEADQIRGQPQPGGNGVQLSRSFLTLRVQPVKILSLDFSHNYFRNTPTFDPRLVGTGLLDKLLFQGASFGMRLELPLRSAVYANFGRSSRSGDTKRSLNQLYGVSKSDIFRTGVRADARYSKFDSSFGSGTYRALSASREVSQVLRFEIQAGEQTYASVLTNQTRSRFVNGNVDWFFATHYVLGGGSTLYRSPTQNYDQVYLNLGYRF